MFEGEPATKKNSIGRSDGGYVLSGRWAWGTGVMHADWVLLNGIVEGETLDIRLFLVPALLCVLNDSFLAMNFSLIVSHLDLLGHHLGR